MAEKEKKMRFYIGSKRVRIIYNDTVERSQSREIVQQLYHVLQEILYDTV